MSINDGRYTKFDAGKRVGMRLQKGYAGKVNMHVNKTVDSYVDDNRKSSILVNFALFA